MFEYKFYNNGNFKSSCFAKNRKEAISKIKEAGMDMFEGMNWTYTIEEIFISGQDINHPLT